MALSKVFYGEFLGLTCERTFSPRQGMQIAFFKAENDLEIELIEVDSEIQPIHGVSIGIEAMNYVELLEKSRQVGLLKEELQILGGTLECFFIQDPDGMGIQLIRK